jgi:hypothetical protein
MLYALQHDVFNIQRQSEGNYFVLSATNESRPLDTLNLYFTSIPVTSQSYKLVPFTFSPQPLNNNEIGIIGKTSTDTIASFYSTGISQHFPQVPSPLVNVVVENEKIKIEIPRTIMVVLAGGLDSVYFQGIISEQ